MKEANDSNSVQNSSPSINENLSDSVLRRRRYHIATTQWEEKWLPWLQTTGALIGFFVVLLPVIVKGWLVIIEEIIVLRFIFEQFSTLGNLVVTILLLYAITSAIISIMWGNSFPNWNIRIEGGLPSSQNILEKNLYPTTKKQEFVFYIHVLQGLLTPFFVVMIFGVLAFFIRLV